MADGGRRQWARGTVGGDRGRGEQWEKTVGKGGRRQGARGTVGGEGGGGGKQGAKGGEHGEQGNGPQQFVSPVTRLNRSASKCMFATFHG